MFLNSKEAKLIPLITYLLGHNFYNCVTFFHISLPCFVFKTVVETNPSKSRSCTDLFSYSESVFINPRLNLVWDSFQLMFFLNSVTYFKTSLREVHSVDAKTRLRTFARSLSLIP